jgi:murein L,D-transpeptidase YcbB/YkuD
MKTRMLPGAACAALLISVAPVSAATPSQPAAYAQAIGGSVDQSVDAFYAARRGAPFWLRSGPDSAAARDLVGILQRSSLDGFASGPALAVQASALLNRARSGDAAALANADRLLTTAWVMYVQALQRPPEGMLFADSWVTPRVQSAQEILARALAAKSLAAHVRSVSNPNPVYAQIRDSAWQQMQATGAPADPRVLANLDRIRAMPFQSRYIVVDAASARLWMVENGQIVDSMKVIVGKPSTPTPMLASTIYYATLNPYWNVPPDLVRKLTAPKVLDQGVEYLKSHGYVVMTGYGDGAQKLDPTKVNWKAVADGRETVAVRQLPGPANSMGQMKFGFPNQFDVYLHDTPQKDLFASADRDISNGCIRVEDAKRLGRWLLGGDPVATSSEPEQHVLLPKPVPVYLTYLTAQADGGQLSFVNDVYGKDARALQQVAAN